MTEVFDLIFYSLKSTYDIFSKYLILDVYGFSFSLWDFFVSLFIISGLVPLVSAGGFGASGVLESVLSPISEKIKESSANINRINSTSSVSTSFQSSNRRPSLPDSPLSSYNKPVASFNFSSSPAGRHSYHWITYFK